METDVRVDVFEHLARLIKTAAMIQLRLMDWTIDTPEDRAALSEDLHALEIDIVLALEALE